MPDTSVASYEFLAPPRIVFGWDRFDQIGTLAAALGRRVFVVFGSRTLAAAGLEARLRETLTASGVEAVPIATISHEPEVLDVDAALEHLRPMRPTECDLVVAVGGGSAIDLAKAVAALATNAEGVSVRDYLEGVGRGLKLTKAPLPMIAVPTTAGTGSEATKNAVISSYDPPFKKSLRDDAMIPRVALVDPALAVSVPPETTAHTGMDAITQLVESFISARSRPLPRALAIDGLRLALGAVEEAVHDGTSRPAREAMAQAALLSGLALANSGLGMAHGVAAALGVHLRVPHGLACAVMLPAALRINRPACVATLADLSRRTALAAPHSSDDDAGDALIERIVGVCERIGIPQGLSALGVEASLIPDLVRDSRGNSMRGNPRELSDDELAEVLEAHL